MFVERERLIEQSNVAIFPQRFKKAANYKLHNETKTWNLIHLRNIYITNLLPEKINKNK